MTVLLRWALRHFDIAPEEAPSAREAAVFAFALVAFLLLAYALSPAAAPA